MELMTLKAYLVFFPSNKIVKTLKTILRPMGLMTLKAYLVVYPSNKIKDVKSYFKLKLKLSKWSRNNINIKFIY